MDSNQDWEGYGPGWENLRYKTLKRDDYTCQRCGYSEGSGESVPLQAHHVVPRSEGGSDSLDNLVTLCRRCHGVQHPDNGTFDVDRSKATVFPAQNADARVSQLRYEKYHECSRCRFEFDTDELVGIENAALESNSVTTVCKPCAGVVCANTDYVTVNDLYGRGTPTEAETVGRQNRTHPLPARSIFPDEVEVARPFVNWTERLFGRPYLRSTGTAFLMAISMFVAYFYAGYGIGDAWLVSIAVGPITRWGGTAVVYNAVALADPTHERGHYRPPILNSFRRGLRVSLWAFAITFGLLLLNAVVVYATGVDLLEPAV